MTSSPEFDFYQALGIPKHANQDEIRNGYLAQSRIHHPDKVAGASSEGFRNINRAYKVLSDPTLREFYDKYGYEASTLAELEFENEDLRASVLAKPDEKLKLLEEKVRTVLRSHDELAVQRFLQPSMSLVFGSRILSYSPLYYSWGYSSSSAGIMLHGGKYNVSVLQSSHVQRGGAAVSRTSLVFGIPFTPLLTSRAILHFMGGRWPGLELMVQKQVSEETVLRQSLTVDGGMTLSTEWVQQLNESLIGNLGVAVGSAGGVSLEVSKKLGGAVLPMYRGKLRLNLSSSTGFTIGSKVKYVVADGLEFHCGPTVSIGNGSFGFELAVQKELPPIVEEQKGAFPTYLNWSVGLQYPDEITVGLKLTRGSFSFQLPFDIPAPETKWALICVLTAWTLTPLVVKVANKIGDRTIRYATKIEHM